MGEDRIRMPTLRRRLCSMWTRWFPSAGALSVTELDRQLTVLIAQYDLASVAEDEAFHRTYPSGVQGLELIPGQSEREHFERLCAHEKASGYIAPAPCRTSPTPGFRTSTLRSWRSVLWRQTLWL
jgi:hypothetical protein